MELSQLIQVNVNLQTVVPLTQGFGLPAVIGEAGRLPHADVQVLTMAGALITGNKINCKVNGVAIAEVSYRSGNDTTLADLATAIQAMDGVATAVPIPETGDNDRAITVTADNFTPMSITEVVITGGASATTCAVTRTATAQRYALYASLAEMYADGYLTTDGEYIAATRLFAQVPLIMVVNKVVSVETWAQALDNLMLQSGGGDFFRLIAITRNPTYQQSIMEWAPDYLKVYYTSTDDTGILGSGTSDLAYTLKGLLLDGVLIYSSKSDSNVAHEQFPEAALAGVMSAENPGSIQADCKQLTGCTADNLNSTQITNALGKNCNIYVPMGGTYVVQNGICCSGNWLDIIEGAYCLSIKMTEAFFALKLSKKKLPFDDKGLAMIEQAFRQVCETLKGPDYGFLESYTITTPKASSFSAVNKADRNATGFVIDAVLTNGIVKSAVTINLTY